MDERTPLLQNGHDSRSNEPISSASTGVHDSTKGFEAQVEVEVAAENSSFSTNFPAQSDAPGELCSTTPLPRKQLLAVMLLFATQPVAFELVMPFVNQMILENGIVDHPEDVGYYSGLIESIFAVMNFVAVLPCSYLSDHYGRKPVILYGTCGLAISVALFGMSKTLTSMVMTRCVAGTLGGAWSAIKVMVGEMTDKSNQAFAFSMLSIAYRTGQSIGQPIGGLLSHPERNIPLPFFKTPFWATYPFSLPCFVAAGLTLISVAVGWATMEETLPERMRKRAHRSRKHLIGSGIDDAREIVSNADEMPKRPKMSSVFTPHVSSVLLTNVLAVFVAECVFTIYPLFAFTPVSSGGLGLSEAVIGTHLALRAITQVCLVWLYPVIERRLGTVRTYQLSMWLWPVVISCFPLLNAAARSSWIGSHHWLMWILLWSLWILWSVSCFIWAGLGIMVNNSAPSKEALAVINGISQMAIVLPQAIAPGLVTATFAWSIRLETLGGNMIWLLLGAITSLAATHALTLKEPTYDWRAERDAKGDRRTK